MKKRIKATNTHLIELVRFLKKKARENEAPVWLDIAERMSKSRRMRAEVNLSLVNRYTEKSDEVIVPGKVLGAGLVDHPVTVAAFAFSDQARQKIVRAKGKCLSIRDLIELNPKGANVKILG